MNLIDQAIEFLTDPTNWTGASGIPQRMLEHLATRA